MMKSNCGKPNIARASILFACLLTILVLLAGCGNQGGGSGSTKEVIKITAEEAKEMMEDGKPCILLDVRTAEEFAEGHIEGAALIPDTEIEDRAPDELPDKNARILVYCRTGVRATSAANMLADMGYTQVYNFGGIVDWPYETISN